MNNIVFAPEISLLEAQSLIADSVQGGFGELYCEKSESSALVFDQGQLKSNQISRSNGMGARKVIDGETYYSHSESLKAQAMRDVIQALNSQSAISSAKPLRKITPKTLYSAQYTPELLIRLNLMKEIDETIRALDPRIINVTIAFTIHQQDIAIISPEFEPLQDIRPMVRLNISVIVEENGRRESGGAGMGGRYEATRLMEKSQWLALGKEALRIALVNIIAQATPAGEQNLLLGAGWPGVLIHEAVGHGLEGDANRRKTSAFSELMGKTIAAKGVNVIDDGTFFERRGSLNFDDEGGETARNTLIEDGVLVAYMQDRLNGELMKSQSSGNCRRESYACPPMPRMTNTYLDNGNDDPNDLLENMGTGIYATGFGGGQVNTTSGKFVFNCTEAYFVKNGTVQYPVKGATLIGDGPTALTKIIGIGNDLALDPGIGNCGKAGQWVPVSVGQPSVLMQGITIGGTEL